MLQGKKIIRTRHVTPERLQGTASSRPARATPLDGNRRCIHHRPDIVTCLHSAASRLVCGSVVGSGGDRASQLFESDICEEGQDVGCTPSTGKVNGCVGHGSVGRVEEIESRDDERGFWTLNI